MRRIVIVTATLLVSALGTLGAQAAPPMDFVPPRYREVFAGALNLIQRGSVHPNPRDRGCLARQRDFADSVERLVGASDMVRRNPAMIELRTRCMPVNPNPSPDY